MKLFLNSLALVGTTDPNPLFPSVLQLPSRIDIVKGDTFQLYYNAISVAPFDFWYRPNCGIGKDLRRYFEVKADEVISGTSYPFTMDILNTAMEVVATASTRIYVHDAVKSPSTAHQFWTIGDSLTANSTWTTEMLRRLVGTGGTPTADGFTNITNHREGQSGKTWNWFVNDEASPFVYSGVLNFEQYRIDNGLPVPKSMNILLTWNGMGQYRDQTEWDAWDDDVYTFINGVRFAFPDCDIVIMSPQYPSLNGGAGDDYGAEKLYYSDTFLNIVNCKKQGQIYDRIAEEVTYSGKVRHIETCLQVDSLWNMPYTTTNVNTRNSAVTEPIGNNGIHPDTKGYYQIADAGYRDFINHYCQ